MIVILGPTASGKTRMGVRLAKTIGGEIISADSRQVYRGMDLGTGKDLQDYIVDGCSIPYHMIDIIDPSCEFNVFEFQKRFLKCAAEIAARGVTPIMVGGTGLYMDSILRRYRMLSVQENDALRKELQLKNMSALIERLTRIQPCVHNQTDLMDRNRLIRAIEIAEATFLRSDEEYDWPEFDFLVLGIHWERTVLRQRINDRLEWRLKAGLVDEVQTLHDSGIPWDRLEAMGLEYRYIGRYLQEEITYQEMKHHLCIHIHQYAKRQETWFRRMEKSGILIHWVTGDDYQTLQNIVDQWHQKP